MSYEVSAPQQGEQESDQDIVIRVSDLSKSFLIYDKPQDRLKQSILPRLKRLLGWHRSRDYFREFQALDSVSFDVRKGETVGIIGRNGAGKSTLLQILCGTLFPSSGTIELKGRVAALLELGSGFNPEFTGRENVFLNATILGLSEEEIEARYDDIVAFADIGEFIDHPVKTYSSGMTLRLAFSVIAHVDADILIIDEALAVGDALFTQKCMRFLRNFMKTGTIFFVSHDTGAVLNLCNRAILLRQGSIAVEGEAKEVVEIYLEEQALAMAGQNQNENSRDLKSRIEKSQKSDRNEQAHLPTEECNDKETRHGQNDVELFVFDETQSSFGAGNAEIVDLAILDKDGNRLSWVGGGEIVCIKITCIAKADLYRPIIGFQVKDRLGQVLFADNTFTTYQDKPMSISSGREFHASFEFVMPVLPTGDYSISPAIAEGTQEEHVQHHWLHDAFSFRVHTSNVVLGLIGLPMRKIEILGHQD